MSHNEPAEVLPPNHLTYLRRVIDTHNNDPSTGLCRICGVGRCADWHQAYDTLAIAGQLMAEPDRWLVDHGRAG